MDFCLQLRKDSVPGGSIELGDVHKVWAIGDNPQNGEIPSSEVEGPPRELHPKEPIDLTAPFIYLYVLDSTFTDISEILHWEEPLRINPTDDVAVKQRAWRHDHVRLPPDRKAQLNEQGYTNVTHDVFLDDFANKDAGVTETKVRDMPQTTRDVKLTQPPGGQRAEVLKDNPRAARG